MTMRPSRAEAWLLTVCTLLAAVALLAPPLAQPAGAHDFADERVLWGIPFALDVLSNLAFAAMGIAGAWHLANAPLRAVTNMQRAMAALFFAGLVLTAAASAWYHLQPGDAGLAVDRLGMSVAFAGLLGLAAAGRISERAGAGLGLSMLALAPLSVQLWATTGNVLPWAIVQFGGMALVVGLACLPGRILALPVRWGAVIGAYALAKLLEVGDHAVFELTGELVSGHTLKHLAAAGAALPVLCALRGLTPSAHNR
jgi:hypothetical protein